LILYLSQADISIPKALDIISCFGKISGSGFIFPVNAQACCMIFDKFPFQLVRDHFTYLRISVTCKFKDLFKKAKLESHHHLERIQRGASEWIA
uniref:Uncharacterized protein n=1 Tax=Gouania willdenowi TaxID=441366 RepID=A0A8C5D8Z6_GOUWI